MRDLSPHFACSRGALLLRRPAATPHHPAPPAPAAFPAPPQVHQHHGATHCRQGAPDPLVHADHARFRQAHGERAERAVNACAVAKASCSRSWTVLLTCCPPLPVPHLGHPPSNRPRPRTQQPSAPPGHPPTAALAAARLWQERGRQHHRHAERAVCEGSQNRLPALPQRHGRDAGRARVHGELRAACTRQGAASLKGGAGSACGCHWRGASRAHTP